MSGARPPHLAACPPAPAGAADVAVSNVHILHIGKTGGTALKHALEPLVASHPWLLLHRHPTRIVDIPAGEKIVFFLRDPAARFASAFNSRLRKGRPRYKGEWDPAETAAFSEFTTAGDLARALSASDAGLRTRAIAAMNGIQHVRMPYRYWLGDVDAFVARSMDLLFVGMQDSLAADAARLCACVGLPSIELPQDPTAAHRAPAGLDTALCDVGRENLRRWYADDYALIDCCARLSRVAGHGWSVERLHAPV